MRLLHDENWRLPPAQLSLRSGDAHVWHLYPLVDAPADCLATLSADERTTADRLRLPADHDRFVWCRFHLRRLLGAYLRRPASDLQFRYGPHGKPRLAESDLQFNVSHAGKHGLIAIAKSIEVGVDIEPLDLSVDAIQIAREFFTPAESQRVSDAQSPARAEIFLQLWTGKEAYLKARGDGLCSELNETDFSEVVFTGNTQVSHKSSIWHVRSLHPHPEVAAAISTRNSLGSLSLFQQLLVGSASADGISRISNTPTSSHDSAR